MIVTPPVAAAQAGQASGGGIIDTFKNAIAGATGGSGAAPATQAPPAGDGSVGLFDGVLKKALFGGAAGAALGFLPFIPGGPILGGVVGALGGAALGVFSNWRKMQSIKAENQAMLAAMGVQVNDPQVQQILQTGNVNQLIPLMEQQQAAQVGQASTVSAQQVAAAQQQAAVAQQQAIAQGQMPTVVDPGSAPAQSPLPTQGSIAVGSGASAAGAINPNAAVNPGVAPANQYASGGGGSAGDAGRPPAPAGVNGANAAAIAPVQAGIGMPTSGASAAATGVDTLSVDPARLDRGQLAALIVKLEEQLTQLKAFLAEQERSEQLDKAAAR